MSSPIHFGEDIEPATMYAPRWARERISSAPPKAVIVPTRSSEFTRKRSSPKLEFSGDRAMLELQRQLVLNPDLIPEPAAECQSIAAPIMLRLFGVVGIATMIAWSMVSYAEMKEAAASVPVNTVVSLASSEGLARADASSALTPTAALVQESIGSAPVATPAAAAAAASAALSAPQNIASTTSTSTSPLATTTAVAVATSVPTSAPQSIASAPAYQANEPLLPQLDADEREALLKRGKDFLADGDLASARLLLRRAAESGNAEAALVLGTTYDPWVIQRLGVVGTPADVDQAREWYKRAAELGSNSASQRLARLAAAP